MKILKLISNDLYKYKNYKDKNDQLLYLDYMSKLYKNNYNIINIAPNIAYRHQGDFYGLLKEYNVPSELNLLVLYINNLNSPDEYDGRKNVIIIPVKPNIPLSH